MSYVTEPLVLGRWSSVKKVQKVEVVHGINSVHFGTGVQALEGKWKELGPHASRGYYIHCIY